MPREKNDVLPKRLKLRKQKTGKKNFFGIQSSVGSYIDTSVGKTAMVSMKVKTRQQDSVRNWRKIDQYESMARSARESESRNSGCIQFKISDEVLTNN